MNSAKRNPRPGANGTGTNKHDNDIAQGSGNSAAVVGTNDLAIVELNIATAPHRESKTWQQGVITWGELLAWMEHPADHKECGNYVLGTLNGDRRTKADMLGRSAITLDVDAPGKGFLDRLASALLGTAYVVHTTFTSTPDAPRYRVIVPLAGELAPDLYRAAVVALMAQVSPAGNEFDKGSAQPERYMFMPSAREPGHFWHQARDGAPLDPAPLLAAAEVLTTEDREPAPVGADGPADPEGYFRQAASGEADKLALTFEGPSQMSVGKGPSGVRVTGVG